MLLNAVATREPARPEWQQVAEVPVRYLWCPSPSEDRSQAPRLGGSRQYEGADVQPNNAYNTTASNAAGPKRTKPKNSPHWPPPWARSICQ